MNTRIKYLLAAAVLPFLLTVRSHGAAGDLYVTCFDSDSVVRITPSGTKSTFATGIDGPLGLAFDRSANLFVGEPVIVGRIYKITPGGTKTVFANNAGRPQGLAFSRSGVLFATDSTHNLINRFDAAGNKTLFASGLNNPQGIGFHRSGALYAAEANAGTINRFYSDGSKTLFAYVNAPIGLGFGQDGDMRVSSLSTNSVHQVQQDGSTFTYASGFNGPHGLAFDYAGNMYVADDDTSSIVKVTKDGVKSTFASGLSGPNSLAFEPPTAFPVNVSSRVDVQSGENAPIAGVIVRGAGSKNLIFRGIGPSLSGAGVSGALQDPVLELYSSDGTLLASNDNWTQSPQKSQIEASGVAPSDSREPAIIYATSSGSLTARLRGKDGATGIGVVEAYDLNRTSAAQLVNISTRAFVGSGDGVLIGGFIVAGGNNTARVVVRALGRSLTKFGISNALSDPTLSLRDGNGTQIAFNDDWGSTQKDEILNTLLSPTDQGESAIAINLPGGNYTAVVAGYQGATGTGVVEVYRVQ